MADRNAKSRKNGTDAKSRASASKSRTRRTLKTSLPDIPAEQRVQLNERGTSYEMVLPQRETDYIQKIISSTGHPYELEMLEDMAKRLEPGDLVLDIGANIGNHAMYLAAVAECKVIALEPNKELAALIETTAALNGISDQIDVVEAGAGAAAGRAYFSALNPDNLGAQSLSLTDATSDSIEIITLDGLTQATNVKVMKIDVEGMELDVLRGAMNLLATSRPIIYIESRSYDEFVEVSSLLAKEGYRLRNTFNTDITNLFIHKDALDENYDETLYRQLVRQRYYLKTAHDRREKIANELSGRLSFAWEKFHAESQRANKAQQDLEELKAQQSAAIAEVHAKLATEEARQQEKETASKALLDRISRQLEQKDDEIARLREDQQARFQAEKERHEQEISRLKDDQRAQYQAEKERHEQEISRLKDEQSRALTAEQERTKALSKDIETARSENSALVANLESFSAQLEAVIADRDSRLSELQTDQAKTLELLRALSESHKKTSPDSVSEALRLALVRDQSLRWAQPIRDLLDELKVKPSKVATFATELGKKRYLADPFARLLLASIAASIDPEPYRQKWLAFRLRDAGFEDLARQLIVSLRGQVEFSPSEWTAVEKLTGSKPSPAPTPPPARPKGLNRAVAAVTRRARNLAQPSGTPQTANGEAKKKSVPENPRAEVSVPVKASAKPTALIERTAKLPKDMKVALLCDEFTYLSFKDEFNATTFEPGNWKEAFERNEFDLFLCESAWSGVDSKIRPWKGKVYASENFTRENRTELLSILDVCRARGIPSVFWNKEDPSHYEDRVHDFVATAKHFDHVLTTAEECVPRYMSEHGCKSVGVLPFATNPRLYNPIETAPRAHRATFAGSWYAYYPERCKDMETIFQSIVDADIDLEIYDRYYGDDDPNHLFPDSYARYIKKSVPADQVPDVFKSAVFGVNINSVTESASMFARRAFELMSSNTFVISNYSRGMEEMFGDTVLFADRQPDKLKMLSAEDVDRMRDEALHLVLQHHTYENRFQNILDIAKVPYIRPTADLTLVARVRTHDDAVAAIRKIEEILQDIPDARTLLLVSQEVPDIDVASYYERYNRLGVTVVSEGYLAKYATAAKRVIETSHFALIDSKSDDEGALLKKALLHLKYFDDGIIQYGRSEKYKFGQVSGDSRLIAKSQHFLSLIQSTAHSQSVGAYCL